MEIKEGAIVEIKYLPPIELVEMLRQDTLPVVIKSGSDCVHHPFYFNVYSNFIAMERKVPGMIPIENLIQVLRTIKNLYSASEYRL